MRGFRIEKNTKLAMAALAVFGAAAIYVASMPRAEAVIGVCTYYSSKTYKTVVGARGTGCCGEVINWGVVTQYRKCDTLYCTDQLCPN